VAFLSALDTASLILDIEYLWDTVVTNHSNINALSAVPTIWIVEFFVASLTFFIVQCYFINKIWALLAGKSYRYWLTGVVAVLALACFAGGVGVCYISSLNHSLMFILTKAEIPACLQQVAAVITDVYITLSLCVVLRGSQAGFERTKTLLDKLTVYAIHRGILTATVQLLHFATYLATYHNSSFVWMIFHIPSTKIYVNSLLAVLNVRHHLRDAGPKAQVERSVDFVDLENFSSRFAAPSNRSRGEILGPASHARIMLTKEVIRDDGDAR